MKPSLALVLKRCRELVAIHGADVVLAKLAELDAA